MPQIGERQRPRNLQGGHEQVRQVEHAGLDVGQEGHAGERIGIPEGEPPCFQDKGPVMPRRVEIGEEVVVGEAGVGQRKGRVEQDDDASQHQDRGDVQDEVQDRSDRDVKQPMEPRAGRGGRIGRVRCVKCVRRGGCVRCVRCVGRRVRVRQAGRRAQRAQSGAGVEGLRAGSFTERA